MPYVQIKELKNSKQLYEYENVYVDSCKNVFSSNLNFFFFFVL